MSDAVFNLLLFLKDKEVSVDDSNIITWINFYDLEEFQSLFNNSSIFVDDGGYECNLQDSCIAIDIKNLLEYEFDNEEFEYIRNKLREWKK